MSFSSREQFHGYKNGHQLLAGDIDLAQDDQDTVDRLSDISGQLRPGERFAPYFSGYSLPSRCFYVIGLTKQDLEAPRAGCVRTHSLFIPMTIWLQRDVSKILRGIYTHLAAGELDAPMRIDPGSAPQQDWPLVKESWTLELVEALFLEQRSPIAVFDASEPELVAFRLLAAAWPSLRSTLSICTFALAPRSISNKSFDLVFAPKSARSRFSDWSGRRIDAATTAYSPRHRWASIIAEAIFQSRPAALGHLDDLGLLDDPEARDETQLRMALLWKELATAAQTAPEAALGLVDIFMTAKPVSLRARESLSEEIRRAVLSAPAQLSNFEFWQFIIALAEKFHDQRLPNDGARAVRVAVRERAKAAPRDCFSALAEIVFREPISKKIASAVGDGLSESAESSLDILNSLSDLGPTGTTILSASESLGPRIVSSIDPDNLGVSQVARSMLSRMELRYRRLFLRRSAEEFKRPEQAEVLSLLLVDVTRSTFLATMFAIGRVTQFSVEELNSLLLDAAERIGAMPSFRNALLGVPQSRTVGHALARTLTLDSEAIVWVANNVKEVSYRAWILSLLVDSATDACLRRFVSNQAESSGVLLALSGEGLRYSRQMMRMLILPGIEVATLAQHGVQLGQDVRSEDHLLSELQSILVSRLIGHPQLIDELTLRNLVEAYSGTATGQAVVDALFPDKGGELAVLRGLQVCQHGSEALRHKLYSQVETIASRVLQVGLYALNRPAVTALAEILEVSGAWNQFGQARASGRVLNACFAFKNLPVGDLVTTAFPIVYSEVKSGNPGFTFLDLFFPDWDHCRTLRAQLVDSYVESVWAPVGLLICAWRVRDMNKIFRYFRKSYPASNYLRNIQDDLHRYSGPNKDALVHAFEEVFDFERVDDEDR